MLPATTDPASTPTSPRTPPPSHIDRRASNPRRTSVVSARSTSSRRSSSSSASLSMYDDALSPMAARRGSSSDSDTDSTPAVPAPPGPSVRRASAAKSPSLPDVDESVSPSMWLDAQADWTTAARRVSVHSAGSASSLGSTGQAPGGGACSAAPCGRRGDAPRTYGVAARIAVGAP
ncbi:hypothetical protein AMAG_20337 [Allomyces macrogynus ATCC 38327]|uniref:Uncharacterized protein n=1 Tax=Allomyces macrogynus (strain ATCC 38327) TaxID=578462 RepID=A0A0L0T9F6_ALLM3|nr:hypothetical protein AMAG_20337 [Allomyces macrogynus ATCC 38327]|eukprot:KNE71345.1 hypothetical protein AMAG_20337 [Allomyces macrogynus ATCC 38327]